jgi:hypothetical protein
MTVVFRAQNLPFPGLSGAGREFYTLKMARVVHIIQRGFYGQCGWPEEEPESKER